MTLRRINFDAIGTKWDIQVQDSVADGTWAELLPRINARIQTFDTVYSRFRDDSLVYEMSQKAGTYAMPTDGYKLLQLYERLYRATDGKLTPLIGQAIADAGYDADYSLRQMHELQSPPKWEDVLSYDEDSLRVKQRVLLDFGAAGKGYLIDLVAEIMEQADIATFSINAGGDILQRSAQNDELAIGLENPIDVSEAIGVVKLTNKSLCASAGSKRKWAGYHHILDPVKLESPSEIIATWVLADDTMTADGISTALFFSSPEKLQQEFDFSYALLTSDMNLQRDKYFPAEVFTA